jgi:protein SCO1/2
VRRAVLALLALVLLAGCGNDDPGEFHGAVLEQPYTVPTTPLTDTDGDDYSLATSTDKRLTLVFFGYINCPDICGVVMSTLASAMTRLDAADRKQVDVVFVTTDPARDTEQAIRAYLDRFDPSFIGLTGDLRTISAIGRPLAVAVEKGQKLPSGGYEVVHGTHVTGIDSDDEAPVIWTQGTSAAQYADDIHQLLAKGN